MAIDMTVFAQRENHLAFRWLGQKNWVETIRNEKGVRWGWYEPDKDNSISNENYLQAKGLINLCYGPSAENLPPERRNSMRAFYRAVSRCFAEGPKMFIPTAMECEAMENVDIGIPFDDYQQPYESLIIELPVGYRIPTKQRLKLEDDLPQYIMCHHSRDSVGMITIMSSYGSSKPVLTTSMWKKREATIEEHLQEAWANGVTPHAGLTEQAYANLVQADARLQALQEDMRKSGAEHAKDDFVVYTEETKRTIPKDHMDAESLIRMRLEMQTINQEFGKGDTFKDKVQMPLSSRIVQRLALNFCILLTQYRERLKERPLNPATYEKFKDYKKKQNPEKREHAEKIFAGEISVAYFDQHVSFYDVEDEPTSGEPSLPTGATVRPHWRRGHHRRQPYGPQASLRKVIFIKPVLVKRVSFIGDVADTSVTYKAR
jgi:hypothetical protein